MVTAELCHNPYLLLTTATFNGKSPKINNALEKYEHVPLKDWVNKVPKIFYDEMNGYDFDLYFEGTKDDYNEVVNAFINQGISEDLVRVIFKKEIECAEDKAKELDLLIEWLKKNPNRLFNFSEWYDQNVDLLESAYSFVFINGIVPENFDSSISIENIDDVNNLKNTDLSNTPVLFFIDSKYFDQFRIDLSKLIKRNDVREQQIFFLIHPTMNKPQVTRLISDLGVNVPQIVDNYDDEIVVQYFKNYPITEYVRNMLDLLIDQSNEMGIVLDNDNLESQRVNAETYKVIDKLEDDLSKLKEANSYFMHTEMYDLKQKIQNNNESFCEQIYKWKKRKTKVTDQNDALEAANDFASYLGKIVYTYFKSVDSLFFEMKNQIYNEFKDKYDETNVDLDFIPDISFMEDLPHFFIPEIKTKLLELKDVCEEEQKKDFLGLFYKEDDEPKFITNYFFEKWRSYVIDIMNPLIDELSDDYDYLISEYVDRLAYIYHEHLVELIDITSKEKENVVSSLSDDERKLQEDNTWLSELNEQLKHIERD